jgi:hypothetical protein
MRWARVAAVVVVTARASAWVVSVASLLIATMLVTDVGTVVDHDVTRSGRAVMSDAHDAIVIVIGRAIIAHGVVIETIDFVAKNRTNAPSSLKLFPRLTRS